MLCSLVRLFCTCSVEHWTEFVRGIGEIRIWVAKDCAERHLPRSVGAVGRRRREEPLGVEPAAETNAELVVPLCQMPFTGRRQNGRCVMVTDDGQPRLAAVAFVVLVAAWVGHPELLEFSRVGFPSARRRPCRRSVRIRVGIRLYVRSPKILSFLFCVLEL